EPDLASAAHRHEDLLLRIDDAQDVEFMDLAGDLFFHDGDHLGDPLCGVHCRLAYREFWRGYGAHRPRLTKPPSAGQAAVRDAASRAGRPARSLRPEGAEVGQLVEVRH